MTDQRLESPRARGAITMVTEGAAASGHGTLMIVADLQPWQLRVDADDDALMPVISRHDTVVIDCSERALIDGEIYAVRKQEKVQLWLYHHGFDGLGGFLNGVAIGTLSSLCGDFRCNAALEHRDIQIVGRCVGRLGAASERLDPVVALDIERLALMASRERLIRQDGGHDTAEAIVPPDIETFSPAAVRNWLQRSMADGEFCRRFMRQQRLDAIGSRLIYIEDQMSRRTADTLDGVRAQLDMLWDVHYAPFPDDMNELGALTISAARQSLRALVASGQSGEQGQAPCSGEPVKVINSPRKPVVASHKAAAQ